MEDKNYVYAGFWMRFGATIIDSVLISVITIPLLVAVYGAEYFLIESFIAGAWDLIISWILPAVAVILFWVYRAATPGKFWLNIRIIDARTGGKLSVVQSIIRYLAYFVSTLPLLLGFIWVAFDKRKQAWHDKIANTLVIIDTDYK